MRGKQARKRILRYFIFISLFAVCCFAAYVAYLWYESRQLRFITYPEFGIHIPNQYEIHGIDVSKYQHEVSWEAVSDMNVRNIRIGFAFMKATEGNGNTDPYFRKNWRRSKKAGIIRGAYHFFIPTKDGRTQARNFIKRVDLESGDLPPVIDVEQTYGASASQIRKEVKAWINTVEQHYGVRPIIYTNVDFYENYLAGHFDDYPLWVAHYLQPEKPRIKRSWSFWQHSETGRVNGILSKVDFNVFNGDSLEFREMLVP